MVEYLCGGLVAGNTDRSGNLKYEKVEEWIVSEAWVEISCSTIVRNVLDWSYGSFGRITFLKHDGLEARRFWRLTFLHREVFSEYLRISKILFWRHYKSEAGRELSRTGSKHDGIEARRENPKLGENPNFGITKFFEEAGGSGNIFKGYQTSSVVY